MNLETLKQSIEDIGRGLPPQDDWLPVLFLEKDKEAAIIGLALMENDMTKDFCAFVMETLIRVTNPDVAAFISCAWKGTPRSADQFSTAEEFEEAYRKGYIPRPRDDPSREEIVIAVVIGVRGENDGQCILSGEVERHEDKGPTIRSWEEWDNEGTEVKGRFAEAIRKGFETVDKNGSFKNLAKLKGLENAGNYTESDEP